MSSSHRSWLVTLGSWCVSAGVAFAAPNPKPAEAPTAPRAAAAEPSDLDRMRGSWEYTFTNDNGAPFRVVKKVDDTTDVVTRFDAQGNVIHAHQSSFELLREGPFRVFKITDTVVIAGPDTGARIHRPRSFAYRIEGDAMIEAWGLLDTDRGPPRTIVWKRIAGTSRGNVDQ